MDKSEKLLEDFIKELIPKEWLAVSRLLISLNYPIPDRKSYIEQLKSKIKDQEDEATAVDQNQEWLHALDRLFAPEDFGIDSPRSALEKFFSKVSRRGAFIPNPNPHGPTPPDIFPFGPSLPLDRGLPSEPRMIEPFEPEFGDDACGRAAARLWEEHINDPLTQLLGPSPARYQDLKRRERLCSRTIGSGYGDVCGNSAANAYARCFMEGGYPRECREEAHRVRMRCQRDLGLEDILEAPLEVWSRWFWYR